MMKELLVDEERWNDVGLRDLSGIHVRVRLPDGTWGPADLAVLEKKSLLAWLQTLDMAGVDNVVGILLGHGHLHE